MCLCSGPIHFASTVHVSEDGIDLQAGLIVLAALQSVRAHELHLRCASVCMPVLLLKVTARPQVAMPATAAQLAALLEFFVL